jgi:hypothetical protein
VLSLEGLDVILPELLRACYNITDALGQDCPDSVRDLLGGLLLSPRGVCRYHLECELVFCRRCWDTTMVRHLVPKRAIANGNWIGMVPAVIKNLNQIERSAITPSRRFASIRVLYKGAQASLRSHFHVFRQDLSTVLNALPLRSDDVPSRLIMVAPTVGDPRGTIPYHTIPYHTIPYHTIPYYTIPYHTPC